MRADFDIGSPGADPSTLLPGAAWAAPLSKLPSASGLHCWRVADPVADCPPAERTALLGALATRVLAPLEQVAWEALPRIPRRRRDWLLGRMAAKAAVRACLGDSYGARVSPFDIVVRTDCHGRPCAKVVGLDRTAVPALSIAHAGSVAVAVAAAPGRDAMLGIDIEPACRLMAGIVPFAFSECERRLLTALGPSTEPEWPLRLWCAKEAVAKAVGRGLLGGPRSLRVRELDARRGSAVLTLAGPLASAFPRLVGAEFTAFTLHDGSLVAAVIVF